MNNTVKWVLVIPASMAATIMGWICLTLVWNITATINIVPQNDLISLGLASFGINAGAAALGIVAGTYLAPAMRARTALVLATVTVFFALSMLVLFFVATLRYDVQLSMSPGWMIWSTFAWVAGAVAVAVQVRKSG